MGGTPENSVMAEESNETPASGESVWNFAFGSNLCPEKRGNRANLQIEEVLPGELQDWRLAFNLRTIPWLEPSMASIDPASGQSMHGVLLRFSPESFKALLQSEGDGHAYQLEPVMVDAYDGRRIKAVAFRALPHRRLQDEVPPSLRYLKLLRSGARQCGLHPEYIKWLDALPHTPRTPWQRWVSATLFSTIMVISRWGSPLIGAYLFRLLRWVDEKLPLSLRLPLNIVILTPVLLFGALVGSSPKLRSYNDPLLGPACRGTRRTNRGVPAWRKHR